MWAAIAAVAMNVLGGLAGQDQANAQARLDAAQNEVNRANDYAANTARDANNELATVVGSLNRAKQAINNRNVLANVGREAESIRTNMFRALSDMTEAGLEQRLDSAFDLGSLAAASGAAGVGGGSRDVMNSTLRMAAARKQQALEQQMDQVTYDSVRMETNTHADAYMAMDSSLILDQLDFGVNQTLPIFSQPAASGMQVLLGGTANAVAQNPQAFQNAASDFSSMFRGAGGGGSYSGGDFTSQVNLRI